MMNKVSPQQAAASPPNALGATNAGPECRPGCGACCIAPSISSPIPGMPDGKPAGVRCIQLTASYQCAIFGQPERPACCSGLAPGADMCGSDREYAIAWLTTLEAATRPHPRS
ncbi:MAG: YkgJ family cysteine cluster protein [Pseudomonadota bacterium]